jgi:NAD(P)-dependent dehydrogenase (short-subunit alcohol dehydrogenase family)
MTMDMFSSVVSVPRVLDPTVPYCAQMQHPTTAHAQMYVDMFSKSLDLECRGGGITVQNMAPGFVATKLAKIRHASLEAPSPATWAAAAVRHIGYEVTSSPYWCALLARRTDVQECGSKLRHGRVCTAPEWRPLHSVRRAAQNLCAVCCMHA